MNVEELKSYYVNDLRWGWSYEAQIIFEHLLEAARRCAGGVILDAGAGAQRYKPFFADSMYIAQEHPESGVKNKGLAEFDILCDVKEIPLRDESVDAVLSTSSLEHMEFPDAFFHEAFRVLKPGGSLMITVPFIHGEHEVPYDFQRPTRYGLQRWYRHPGFVDVEVRPASSSFSTITTMINLAVFDRFHPVRRELFSGGKRSVKMASIIALYFGLIKPFNKLMLAVFDDFPDQNKTAFPMGWVASGKKPGSSEKRLPADKASFLRERMREGFVFVDGSIRPAEDRIRRDERAATPSS